MERQIRKLGMALLGLFLIAFVQINYIQVFAADRIANDPANAQRQLIAEYKVDRGSILAADGTTVLASSRKSQARSGSSGATRTPSCTRTRPASTRSCSDAPSSSRATTTS